MATRMQFILVILLAGFILASPASPSTKDEVSSAKNSTDAAKVEDTFSIANWHSPPEVANNFPFYLSGYDQDDRPIIVIDMGLWDVRAWYRRGKAAWTDLERHAEKMLYIVRSELLAKNMTDDNGITKSITDELGIIVDFDGFNVAQLTTPKVLQFMTTYLGQLEALQERISYAYFINVNAVASVVVRLLKPVLGKVFERVEVYGTQRSQWLPVLRRNLPLDQIPEKFGGKKGHKVLVSYG